MPTETSRAESPILTRSIEQIDACLRAAIDRRPLPEALRNAITYAVLGGGKRLRPVLVLLSCEAVGGRREDGLLPAAALELIHTFSLVHDDLPAMDDDALRRGRPTLHVRAGEAMAILAGDAMTSLSFELISEAPIAPEARAEITAELARATTSMVAGQVYDTLGGLPEGLDAAAQLKLIHRNKTGALLRAACRIGGICANAAPDKLEDLTRYGEAIGLMFQIVDDVLDVTQSTEHLGKTAGKDESAGKLTYPAVLGLEQSRAAVEHQLEEARAAVARLGAAARPLDDLASDMAIRTK